MPSPASVLFPAVTESPAREFVAAQLTAAGCERLLLPAAGRFAVAAAAVPVLGAKNIEACDTALIPTLVGWLAAGKDLEDLDVHTIGQWCMFVDGAQDDVEWCAGLMCAVKYAALPSGTAYMAEQRRAILANLIPVRQGLARQLREQVKELAGIRYQVKGLPEVAAELVGVYGDPKTCLFADFRGLKSRVRTELAVAEDRFWPGAQLSDDFDPAETGPFLQALGPCDELVLACVSGDKHIPDGWVRLLAAETSGSVDYVIANRDPGGRHVKTRRRPGSGSVWPLYADEHEIRPDSEVGMVCVDKDTALHYRDLLVHRLAGTTVSERYYLFLIDGRVVSVFGMHFRDQVTGKTAYCAETFGITITSQRYERLGKLLMLCLTSTDMLAFLLHTSPTMLQRNPPLGLQTSSPTLRHEGKSDRGVMRLVSREPRPGGGFHLVYRTEWRAESWPQVMARWHQTQAHLCRDGWDGPRLDPPQTGGQNGNRRRGRARQKGHDHGSRTAE